MMGRKRFEAKLFHSLSLAKLVPEGHLLRRLDETLDLSFVRDYCGDYYSHTGQPSVDPVVIFKMMLLGYLYGIGSERRLAEECGLHLGFRWYLGYDLDEKTPDHSVLSKARRRYAREVFEEFFQEVLKRCVEAGLVGGEVIFADSTLVAANAAKRSVVKREERFEPTVGSREYLEQLDAEGAGEASKRGALNRRVVSRSDPDAALVKRRGKGSQLAYKQHFTVDGKQRVITAVEVTDGAAEDAAQVEKLLEGQPIRPRQFCADTGYGVAPVYGHLESQGIQAVIPRRGVTGNKSQAGRISCREFQYDEAGDEYLCPQGKRLRRKNYDPRWDRYNYRPLRSDCRGCPIRERCSNVKTVRCITRPRQQAAVDRALRFLHSAEGQGILARRGYMAEWVVSEAKGCHGLGRAKFRGLEKVRIQGLMTAAVQNLKRLMAAGSEFPSPKSLGTGIKKFGIHILKIANRMLCRYRQFHIPLPA